MTSLSQLKVLRGQYKGALTRAQGYLDSLDASNVDLYQLRVRKEAIVSKLRDFELVQYKIEELDEAPEQQRAEAELFEQNYFAVLARFERMLSGSSLSVGAAPSSETSNHGQQIRLPKIELPQFHGTYEEWYPFYDTFNSLIHSNMSLSAIQKFHYLKSSLKGDAAAVIGSLELSSLNYIEAWNLLKERYDNKRFVIHAHSRALMDIPLIQRENHTALRQLVNTVLKHTRALKALHRPVDQWDDLLIPMITAKIDPTTNKHWEETLTSSSLPTFRQLVEFLTQRCQILEAVAGRPPPATTSTARPVKPSRPGVSAHVSTNAIVCAICTGNHPLHICEKFGQMTVQQRVRAAKAKGLCTNCLRSSSHSSGSCTAGSCQRCGRRHNTLLHLAGKEPNETAAIVNDTDVTQTNAQVSSVICTARRGAPSKIHLSTALVELYDDHGNALTARALLDSGAEQCFITEEFAKRLNKPTRPINLPIDCIGGMGMQSRKMLDVKFKSRYNTYSRTVNCFVLRKITQDLPNAIWKRETFSIPKNIKLADPTFYKTGPIDILIGAEWFYDLHCVGQIKPTERHPVLQKTQLGWIISGRVASPSVTAQRVSCNLATSNTDALLVKLWQLDDYGSKKALTSEGRECESQFMATYKRNAEGRFIVKLPVKEGGISSLGESRATALKRFFNLERKLNKQPSLKGDYVNFMREYQCLGHMKAVSEIGSQGGSYYLPHHAVIKQSSATTKTRVVFDASCKTSTGVSLNDALMVGPTVQQDLFSIIARFRTFTYVLTADISKMYRQVLVDKSQTALQRILWRERADEPIQTFELATVTYGTAPASFLATRCLLEAARLEREKYPKGATIIERDFYVDDLLTGSPHASEVIEIRDEIIEILRGAGFELHKWSTNSPELLTGVWSNTDKDIVLDRDNVCTLGVRWSPIRDVFRYSIPPTNPVRVTKRSILSSMARLFDPLGLLGPVVIVGKILMQQLWREGVDWDESVPLSIHTRWQRYSEQLAVLNEISIPRHVIMCGATSIQLHGFSDASEEAYGACIYVVSGRIGGSLSGRLLCAKSRVAPLKNLSMPKLELCGALLLSRLMRQIVSAISIAAEGIHCWSDSSVALAWLSSSSRTWTTFVANRVAEIQETLPEASWGHVPTLLNPADIISRGATPHELVNNSLWWEGPTAFFNKDTNEEEIPISIALDDLPERRHTAIAGAVSLASNQDSFHGIFTRYSSLTRLIRVTAFCLRFAHNAASETRDRLTGPLSRTETDKAKGKLVRACQSVAFRDELGTLKGNDELKPNNRLITLHPFIDADGLLRVGGRLQKSFLSYTGKHPILLPKSHPLTDLIVRYEHVRHLHAGPQLTLAAVRANYWPIAGRSCVRNVVSKCVVCFRHKPRNLKYIMGELPEHRVTPSRPFERTGVDYCGPLPIREGRRRNAKISKAYVAIFVCMATKATHIELVSDLTTEAFLAALKRFIGRRGKPSHIYSDNGTNFVGANRELREMWKEVFEGDKGSRTLELISDEGLTWHFIPPGAPNFGGLWEAAVKSAKHHLKRTSGSASLSFEEMSTLLIQIEAVLNSRPLTPLSNDPNDLSYLTPGHFLIGDSLLSTAEPDLSTVPDNRLSRWQHVEKIRQHFWQRWSSEYLNWLHLRPKRASSTTQPLQEGNMVVIRDDHLPPLRWLLGRVEKPLPGTDGVVRAALVRTVRGIIKRPTTRLCMLPIEQ